MINDQLCFIVMESLQCFSCVYAKDSTGYLNSQCRDADMKNADGIAKQCDEGVCVVIWQLTF